MTATNGECEVPLGPGTELTQLRHDWLLVVLTLATGVEIKQVVVGYVAGAGRRCGLVASR